MTKPRMMILIPAYNEEPMIGVVIQTLPKKLPGVRKILHVVVDDGSIDRTAGIAKQHGATVLRHIINRGLGGALGTGLRFANDCNIDILVTMDADGQHLARDIPRLIEPIIKKRSDVVIGSRLYGRSNMPLMRKLVNILSNIATWFFFGVWTSDSQSGLRAFSKRAIKRIRIRTQRMEVSSELFREIRRNRLKKAEIPIEAIYTTYSTTKGQPIANASNVITKLFLRSLR